MKEFAPNGSAARRFSETIVPHAECRELPEEIPVQASLDFRASMDVLDALVATELTFPGLSNLLAQWTLAFLDADCCFLELKRPSGPSIQLIGETVRGKTAIREITDPLSFKSLRQDSLPKNRECLLRIPIAQEGFAIGEIVASRTSRPFSIDDNQILNQLVSRISFLLNYRMRMDRADEMAFRDPLTGLYNRRYLHQQMEYWLPKARKERLPVSLFLLDVDHFKSFNDNWGHEMGDRVLRLLGGLMNSLFRSEDVVCRFGGEEFAILLCDHREGGGKDHPTEVLGYAERLRKAAEALPLAGADGRALAHVTISGGIATFPWDASTSDDLLRKADEALYRAKRSGRNRIFFAAPTDASKAG